VNKIMQFISNFLDFLLSEVGMYFVMFICVVYMFANKLVIIPFIQGLCLSFCMLIKSSRDRDIDWLKEKEQELEKTKHNLSVYANKYFIAYDLLTDEQKALYYQKVEEEEIPNTYNLYGSIISKYNPH